MHKGGFPHVAAAGCRSQSQRCSTSGWNGVSSTKQQKALPPHFFSAEVTQAIAQARLLAEIDVRKKDPRVWLSRGPGRETANNPGWTRETKPIVFRDNRRLNILATPEWMSLWSRMLEAIQQFPEARAALAAAVEETEPKQLPPPS